ncbi:MAG: FkbM family methyltransferase [Cytophagales bacterium]|nr:FkbM family methyltransferase [Cytophagales bacterium]
MKRALIFVYNIFYKIFSRFELGRFYLFRILKKYITSKLKSDFVQIHGHKMYLDYKDSLNLSIRGSHEPFTTEFVKTQINKNDIVIDLGANIGYYTLIFARCVGEGGVVFAFEPDPDNFQLLVKNVKVNGYHNVILINKAVSNYTGKIKLYLSEDNYGDHRIYKPLERRKSIEIESIRLDDYFKDKNIEINFIKMDIQGAEYGAIQGMSSILKKYEKIKMITEFWPIGLQQTDIEPEDYINLLHKTGFKVFCVDEQKKQVKHFDITELLERFISSKEKFANLLCIKK